MSPKCDQLLCCYSRLCSCPACISELCYLSSHDNCLLTVRHSQSGICAIDELDWERNIGLLVPIWYKLIQTQETLYNPHHHPEGMINILQTLDAVVNKPFKVALKHKCAEWMNNAEQTFTRSLLCDRSKCLCSANGL